MKKYESKIIADKKYNDSVKKICIKIKYDSDKYNTITDIVVNNNSNYANVVNAMIDYCIINNIDISAYLNN